MGEQKRKHVAEVIAKATLCGAVIEQSNETSYWRGNILPGKDVYRAVIPEDKDVSIVGETAYQCAVKYLQHMGVSYEALVYGTGGHGSFGVRAASRLCRRQRKRGRVPRKSESTRFV